MRAFNEKYILTYDSIDIAIKFDFAKYILHIGGYAKHRRKIEKLLKMCNLDYSHPPLANRYRIKYMYKIEPSLYKSLIDNLSHNETMKLVQVTRLGRLM